MTDRQDSDAAATGEAAEWIKHDGGDLPVDKYANVNWRTADRDYHNNDKAVSVAIGLDWRKLGDASDIVAYRVVAA